MNASSEQQQMKSESDQQSQINVNISKFVPTEDLKQMRYNLSVQEMLIINKHYQQFLIKMVQQQGCKIELSFQTYRLFGQDEQSIKKCQQIVKKQLIDKLNLIKWQITQYKQQMIYLNSPQRIKLLNDRECHLTKYKNNQKTYFILDSIKRTKNQLVQIKNKLNPNSTFTVDVKSRKHKHPIYKPLSQYLQKSIDIYLKDNLQKQLIVQLDLRGIVLYINASTQKLKMQAKNNFKNVLRSCIIIVITLNQKSDSFSQRIQKYLSQVTKLPLVCSKISEYSYIIISKDNIIKQLLGKQKLRNLLNKKKLKIGIFLVKERFPQQIKKQLIQSFCNQKGYKIVQQNQIYYFKNISQQKNILNDIIDFTMELIQKIIKNKQNIRTVPKQTKPKKIIQNDQIFYTLGQIKPYKQIEDLSQKFGCDIIVQKIYLNSKYLKKYNNETGDQQLSILFTKQDWCEPQKIQVYKIQRQKMSGVYFYGKLKRLQQSNVIIYFPQYIIRVI